MKNRTSIILFIASLFILSCSNTDDSTSETTTKPTDDTTTPDIPQSKPNILLIIADDMGLDATPNYSIGNTKPNMPTLQSLMNTGITFNNVWANPTCSPTRAGIITGKYGTNNGVTKVDDELSLSEISLQKYIDQNTNTAYSQAVIGKWHLSKDANHPNQLGIDYYAGSIKGALKSYTNWDLTINGETTTSSTYTTTKYTDLAIDWVANQSKPWFLWLAHNAPHTPFHLPPTGLHSQGDLPTDEASIDANPLPYYMAAIEAMDSEIGRLLNSMSQEVRDNTVIIFVGDNGTPGMVAQEYNSRRAKGSIYQGGVNVPMVISGKNILGNVTKESTLINTTDLFATISEIAGVNTLEINDSKSFKKLLEGTTLAPRNYTFTEAGKGTNQADYAIRNATHKYLLFEDGKESLFNLIENPLESPDLLNTNQSPLSEENTVIKNELITTLNRIIK